MDLEIYSFVWNPTINCIVRKWKENKRFFSTQKNENIFYSILTLFRLIKSKTLFTFEFVAVSVKPQQVS